MGFLAANVVKRKKTGSESTKKLKGNVGPASVKSVSTSEEVKSDSSSEQDKKTETHPPASKMVMETIKCLKKRNGAPTEDICKHIEGVYKMDMKKIKPLVRASLKRGVEKGTILQLEGSDKKERFKINKDEDNKKVKQQDARKKKEVSDVPKKKGK